MSRSSFQPRTGHGPSMLQIVCFLILIVPAISLEFLPRKTPSYLEPTQTTTRLPHGSAPSPYPYPFPSDLRVRPRGITIAPVIGYAYWGCWVDNSNNRILAAERIDYIGMEPTLCRNMCATLGCSIFGIENSSECYCDNTMTTTVTASATDCSMTCGGDSADECGGWSRINIYSATTPLSAVIAMGTNTVLTPSSTMIPSPPSGPSATPVLSPNTSPPLAFNSSSGGSVTLTIGATVGIAIGSAAAAALVCSVVFFVFYRRHREPPTSAAYASQPWWPGTSQNAAKPSQDAAVVRQTWAPGYPGSPMVVGGNLYRQVHEMEVPKTQ